MLLKQTAILTRLSYGTRLQKVYHPSRQTTYQKLSDATARRLTYHRLSQHVPTSMRQNTLFNVHCFMLFS